MVLSYFERCLDDYRRTRRSRAGQAAIDDAWSKLLAVAIELRGSAPSEASQEVAAAYAVGNARVAKNAAQNFDSINSTIDAWLAALERFHQIVTFPG
jgi:hypothetical protein